MSKSLDLGREDSSVSLIVPLLGPVQGANVPEDALEVVAWLVFFALHLLTPVEVNVVLPAVPKNDKF